MTYTSHIDDGDYSGCTVVVYSDGVTTDRRVIAEAVTILIGIQGSNKLGSVPIVSSVNTLTKGIISSKLRLV